MPFRTAAASLERALLAVPWPPCICIPPLPTTPSTPSCSPSSAMVFSSVKPLLVAPCNSAVQLCGGCHHRTEHQSDYRNKCAPVVPVCLCNNAFLISETPATCTLHQCQYVRDAVTGWTPECLQKTTGLFLVVPVRPRSSYTNKAVLPQNMFLPHLA